MLTEWRAAIAAVAGDAAGQLFADAMTRTLARTLQVLDDGTVFVITGDIPAMWLRDSATQMLPYLRIAQDHPDSPLADLLVGIVRRQLFYLRRDPYANAFNIEANGRCHEPRDLADDPWLWEREYEIDSLCFLFLLAHQVWATTGSAYRFVRPDTVPIDTLTRDGRGSAVGPTGMTWAGFRPSDDACTYGYHIPGNLMAIHCLRLLGDLLPDEQSDLAAEATVLADRLTAGVAAYGVVEHPAAGQIWAYEVDGLGRHLLMDDTNGLTSGSRDRALELVQLITSTTAGTGHVHEGFDVDDDARFTRPWFSWADSMFCALAMSLV